VFHDKVFLEKLEYDNLFVSAAACVYRSMGYVRGRGGAQFKGAGENVRGRERSRIKTVVYFGVSGIFCPECESA